MQIKCVAIDDEPLALDLIKEYITRFPALKLINTFDDAIAGAEFLRSNPVDLLFIDINMPDITGIELLRSLEEKPSAIFTTAYKKFAYEGFELDAVDYLLNSYVSNNIFVPKLSCIEGICLSKLSTKPATAKPLL